MTDCRDDLVIASLQKIGEENRKLHEQRIARELAVVLAAAGFYLGAVGLKIAYPDNFPSGIFGILAVLLGFCALAFGVFVYLRGSASANEQNQLVAQKAEDLVLQILRTRPTENEVKDLLNNNVLCPAKIKVCHLLTPEGRWAAFIKWLSLGLLYRRDPDEKPTAPQESKDKRPNKDRWLWQAWFVLCVALASFLAICLL